MATALTCGSIPMGYSRTQRASLCSTCRRYAGKAYPRSLSCLLLNLQKLPGSRVHRDAELGARHARAIDHVPLELVFLRRPLDLEVDGRGGIRFHDLVATVR